LYKHKVDEHGIYLVGKVEPYLESVLLHKCCQFKWDSNFKLFAHKRLFMEDVATICS